MKLFEFHEGKLNYQQNYSEDENTVQEVQHAGNDQNLNLNCHLFLLL